MTYTATATRTTTTTMTEARVRTVMRKVAANFRAFVTAGLVTEARAARWSSDLTYMQTKEALDSFEVQVRTLSGQEYGLRYTITAVGTIVEDSRSGGLDVYGIPSNSTVSLFAKPLPGRLDRVKDYLKSQGWHFDGNSLEGETSEGRSFSSGGYGITRAKVGTWP